MLDAEYNEVSALESVYTGVDDTNVAPDTEVDVEIKYVPA